MFNHISPTASRKEHSNGMIPASAQRKSKVQNSRKMSSRQVQKLPKTMLTDQASQDIFILCKPNSTVELAKSSHVGHQLFKSLAELYKTKFVENLMKDPARPISRRIALQLLNSVTDKGRGTIYIQPLNNDVWKEVIDQNEGQSYVFSALISLFGIKDLVKEEERAPVVPPSHKRSMDNKRSASPESLPPKNRVRFDVQSVVPEPHYPTLRQISKKSFDAAKTLAHMFGENEHLSTETAGPRIVLSRPSTIDVVNGVLSSPADTEQSHNLQRMDLSARSSKVQGSLLKSKASSAASATPALQPRPFTFAPRTLSPNPQNQFRSPFNSQRLPVSLPSTDGITISQLRPNDIIVGGPGVGVLDLPSTGNRWLRSMVESKSETFSKFDKKGMLHMAQATVSIVYEAAGRFMAIDPASKLLREIKKDKAWTKTLQTYKEYVHTNQHLESIKTLKEAIQIQESWERTQFGLPSDRHEVQQMLEEARAHQEELKKPGLPSLPLYNNARVLAFAAKLRQFAPPQG